MKLLEFLQATAHPNYTVHPNGHVEIFANIHLADSGVTELPDRLTVRGTLNLTGTDVSKLPGHLHVHGVLNISGTAINALPADLSVGSTMYLQGSRVRELPLFLAVLGNLSLANTPIEELPRGLIVSRTLDLSNSAVRRLPDNLGVGGHLDLSNTPLESLPAKLQVRGRLRLNGSAVARLPADLRAGALDMRDTAILELPESLVGLEELYLDPEKLRNVTYRKGCGRSNRTVFCVMLNGLPRVGTDCFLGTLPEFEAAVDREYCGDAAKQYKQAARDCVVELVGTTHQLQPRTNP